MNIKNGMIMNKELEYKISLTIYEAKDAKINYKFNNDIAYLEKALYKKHKAIYLLYKRSDEIKNIMNNISDDKKTESKEYLNLSKILVNISATIRDLKENF